MDVLRESVSFKLATEERRKSTMQNNVRVDPNDNVTPGFGPEAEAEPEVAPQASPRDVSVHSPQGQATESSPSKIIPIKSCFNDIRGFVGVFSVYIMVFNMLDMYFFAVMTTIEKRFGLTSSQTGMLLSIKQLAYILTISITTHASKNLHRPRVLGFMGILASLGGFFSLLPHILYANKTNGLSGSQTSAADLSTKAAELCDESNETLVENNDCGLDANQSGFNMGAFVLFSISAVLIGIAMTVNNALSTTYIDDATTEADNGFYLGIVHAMWPLGPMVGFMAGGYFTTLHEYLTDPGYDSLDPRWIGAWWLGYLICPVLLIIPSIILPFFPRLIHRSNRNVLTDELVVTSLTHLPSTSLSTPTSSTTSTRTSKTGLSLRKSSSATVISFAASLYRLLSSPEYMLLVGATCFVAFLVTGLFPFLPKYLELQFHLSAALANVLTGSVATSMAAFGTLLGGVMVSRAAWKIHQTCVFLLIANLLVALLLFICTGITCPKQPIRGIQTDDLSCAADCHCSDTTLMPVCSPDGQMFRSPCFAGCKEDLFNQTYIQCACVPGCGCVTAGFCDQECSKMYPFLLFVSLAALIGMMAKVPAITIFVQCVHTDDRSLALGMVGAIVGLICNVPGPMVYGGLIDGSCIHWTYTCGQSGACALYDMDDFRLKLFGITAGFQLFASLFTGTATVIIWRKRKLDVPTSTEMPRSPQNISENTAPVVQT